MSVRMPWLRTPRRSFIVDRETMRRFVRARDLERGNQPCCDGNAAGSPCTRDCDCQGDAMLHQSTDVGRARTEGG